MRACGAAGIGCGPDRVGRRQEQRKQSCRGCRGGHTKSGCAKSAGVTMGHLESDCPAVGMLMKCTGGLDVREASFAAKLFAGWM
jgi:hypothetical protein